LDLVGVQMEWASVGWTWLGLVGFPLDSNGPQPPPGWIPNGVAGPQWSPIGQVGECEVLLLWEEATSVSTVPFVALWHSLILARTLLVGTRRWVLEKEGNIFLPNG